MKKILFTIAVIGMMSLASCGSKATEENVDSTNDTITVMVDSVGQNGEEYVSTDTVEKCDGTVTVNPETNE